MDKVLDLMHWAGSFNVAAKPWLLLGKGPSFSQLPRVHTDDYQICTLNHVIRECPADVAHIIDIDVVIDCADAIEKHAGVLLMPYHPHELHRPSSKTLAAYAAQVPVLAKFAAQGRLVGYNLSSTVRRYHDSPLVKVEFFSVEAALNALAIAGARKVRSLGIDGGSQYAGSFADLTNKTRLANGHPTFDGQFRQIAATILWTGVDYAPWTAESPIKVFVGSDQAQVAGMKVLEYSIKKHASMTVDVQLIDDTGIPVPIDEANRSRTGFSFSRFRIPQLCHWTGRGLYLDADMLVFADIAQLWQTDMKGHHVLYSEQSSGSRRVPQFSVMLLDCAGLDWDVNNIVASLDSGEYDYVGLMQKLCMTPSEKLAPLLPETWNSLEKFVAGETNLIHYTDMPTQPWVSHANKNGHIWYDHCREAIDCGFISKDYLYGEVEKGHVSPQLPTWLGMPAPDDFDSLNKAWLPPFRRYSGMRPVPGLSPQMPGNLMRQRMSFVARSLARRSPAAVVDVLRRVRGRLRGY